MQRDCQQLPFKVEPIAGHMIHAAFSLLKTRIFRFSELAFKSQRQMQRRYVSYSQKSTSINLRLAHEHAVLRNMQCR